MDIQHHVDWITARIPFRGNYDAWLAKPCLGCCFGLRVERRPVRRAHLYCAFDNYIFVGFAHSELSINDTKRNEKSFSLAKEGKNG